MSAEELIRKDRLRPVVSGFGKGRYWQYRDIKGHYTVVPTKEEAIKRANEALLATEVGMPVKGEQAGMLGVPGKYVEQKRPWTPGQVGIESYVKYKEAMGKPGVVTPEVTANLNNLLAHLKEAPLSKSSETYLRKSFGDEVLKQAYNTKLITRSPKDIYTITLKGQEVLKAIPKAEAKVEAEAMKPAEKPGKNLYWYSVAELKRMCQDKGLSTEGSKESLIRRLR